MGPMGRLERLLPGVLAWVCYGMAGLAALRHYEPGIFPPNWGGQTAVLLSFAALFSLATMILRRRFVIGVLVVIQTLVGLVVAYPFVFPTEFLVFFFVAVAAQAVFLLGRAWWLSLVLLELLLGFQILPRVPVWGTQLPGLPWDVLLYLQGFGVGAVLLFKLVRDHRVVEARSLAQRQDLQKAVLDVLQLNREHQEFALLLRERSGEEERRRLTRDIHDILGFTLVNLQVVFEMALDQTRPDQVRLVEILRQGLDQSKEGLQRSRVALRVLRSPQDQEYDWKKHIRRLVKSFMEITGVTVVAELDKARSSYPETTRTFAIHFVQETMANAYRHGRASRIELLVREDGGFLKLDARDNGKGTHLVVEGIGFRGIQERSEALGGSFSFTPLIGGFQVEASVPVGKEVSV